MPAMEKKLTQVGGRKVAYLDSGKAAAAASNSGGEAGQKAVFLLHGWGGSKESWQPLLTELTSGDSSATRDRRFFALDFPGFGESEEPANGWTVTDYAKWFEHFAAAVYKSEGLAGDYDLIVHSFGGRVVLKLFAEDFSHSLKARPEKVVLIAAAGVKHRKSLSVRIAAAAARSGKKVMSWPVLRHAAPLAQKVLYKALRTHDYEKSSGVMRETFLKVIDEDLKESIEQVKCPALIVWGEKDTYVPVKDARLMHEKIANSELHIFKDGRHGIHKTHAAQIAKWVKEFLKK